MGDAGLGDAGPDRTGDTWVMPRWMKVAVAAAVGFIGVAMAFAIFEPIQVLPRMRLAPGFVLVDDDRAAVISDDLRGSVTLYALSSPTCGDACRAVDDTMAEVATRARDEVDLGDIDFRLVTINLDPQADPDQQRSWRQAMGLDAATAPWQVLTAEPAVLDTVVRAGFGYFYESDADPVPRVDPGFVLVDGAGVVRGDYRYSTLADDADKLVRHLDLLGRELRNSHGVAGAAYEAAHLFLCYP